MEIIAYNGGAWLVRGEDDGEGVCIDLDEDDVTDVFPVGAILKFSYWNDSRGPLLANGQADEEKRKLILEKAQQAFLNGKRAVPNFKVRHRLGNGGFEISESL